MSKDSENTVRLDDKDTILNSDNTVRLDNNNSTSAENTERISEKTVIKSGFGGGIKVNPNSNTSYKFNNIEYRIVHKVSESTSEAQIFLIEKDCEHFILKYYYPFVKPKLDVIKKLRSLSHPDIIGVIDYGYFEERFFEISIYADQGSLADNIPVTVPLQIKSIIQETVNAIKFCHDNGIIHRDIKPSNIFLKNKETKNVLVGDFGIASIMNDGESLRRTTNYQTPIYAAPEFKLSYGGESLISNAVDYYSFGITIWEMITGELPPNGMDELEFLREMFDGTPPIPESIEDEYSTLIKGLTTRKPDKRWGYKEVIKWLNGERVPVYQEEDKTKQNKFLFGEDKNGEDLYASNPKELAKLIYAYPDIGRKHLYRGTIKDWLREIGDQRLLVEIADITEYKFKDDEVVGSSYAIYFLDKNFPFYSLDNKPLQKKKELVDELRYNWKHYAEELADPNHRFYLFLLSKNAHQEVERYREFYNNHKNEKAFYYILYSLEFSINKNAPFAIFNKGKLKTLITSLEELAKYFWKYPSSVKPLYNSADFEVWLNFKDKDIIDDIIKLNELEKGITKSFFGQLPYILAPDLGYVGIKGNSIHSLQELGEEFYNNAEEYKRIFKNQENRIFYYLKANGFNGETEFIRKCFIQDKKPTPFNENFSMIKIIKGFEFDLPYVHKGISYFSPKELKSAKLNSTDFRNELSNQDSYLNMWLSVFYHEQPLSDDKKYYIYFREDFYSQLDKYLLQIKKLYKKNSITEKYEEALDKVSKLKKKYENIGAYNKVKLSLLIALPIVPALLLLLYSIMVDDNPLPGNILAVTKWYYLSVMLLVSAFIFNTMHQEGNIEFGTGCIGGPIIGLIVAIILYLLIVFTISVPIVLAIVLSGVLYFIIRSIYYNFSDYEYYVDQERNEADLDGINNLVYDYTFGNISKISISQSEELLYQHKETTKALLKTFAISFIPALFFSAAIILLVYYTDDLNLISLLQGK